LAIYVQLQTAIQDDAFYGGEDIQLDIDPGFKYNIYR
jgi:hypothetical protein